MIPLFKVLMSPSVAAEIQATIDSGTVTEGPRVERLERRLAEHLGVPVLTLNSGTSALHLAATLLRLEPGDEVISTPITCAATNVAIVRAGGTIVWADVDPITGRLDPDSVRRVYRQLRRPRAVMAVDWGGALCDFGALADATNDLPVIEDAAHAFGVQRQGYPAFTCWSFQAIKHLTTADGGGLYVADPVERARAQRLRWFGIDRRAPGANIDKPIAEAGFKYHMNDLNASIGLANFEIAVRAVDQHRENAAYYDEALQEIRGIRLPPPDLGSAWWLYTILLTRGDQGSFIEFMRSRGVACSRVHTRNDVHAAFAGSRYLTSLPGVSYFDAHQVAIPVHWGLSGADRVKVVAAIRAWSQNQDMRR